MSTPLALAYLLVVLLLVSTGVGLWVVHRLRQNDAPVKRWTQNTLGDLKALGDDTSESPRLRTDPRLMRPRQADEDVGDRA